MKGKIGFVGVSALVLGNLIGAGILALPVSLGVAGMIPSVILLLVYGSLMFFSAEILVRETVESRDSFFDLPSLYGKYLGKAGMWIASMMNMLILYGLLIAYIAGGAQILANILGLSPSVGVQLAFAAALTLLAATDVSIVDKYNTVLVFGLLLAFVALVGTCCDKITPASFQETHWEYLGVAIPLAITASHFHNIIPTISSMLEWNVKLLRKAIVIGIVGGVLMNLAWVMCGIGCLPRLGDNGLLAAYAVSAPATIPMGCALKRPVFDILAATFSIIAIATSFLASGIGLQNFIRDFCGGVCHCRNMLLARVFTFAPPILIVVIYPDVFLKALDVVGGIGIVTLFGIFPCLVGLMKKTNTVRFRIAAAVFLVLSSVALVATVGGMCGVKAFLANPLDEVGPDVQLHVGTNLREIERGDPAKANVIVEPVDAGIKKFSK